MKEEVDIVKEFERSISTCQKFRYDLQLYIQVMMSKLGDAPKA
jgi:RNA processing factor Prp31